MKKLFAISLSLFMVAIVVTIIAMPLHGISTRTNPDPAMAPAIPDSVNAIFEKSCYPCHSEPGKAMALSNVNFDKWETYKPEKKEDKAEDICKQLKKGSMPPKSFRNNNPDKVPTAEQVKIICDWVASLESENVK